MIQIQGTLKLLIYEIERNPNKWKKKQSHHKLASQIANLVGRTMIKSYKRNKIPNGCSLQSKQIIAIKIIMFTVMNVDL